MIDFQFALLLAESSLGNQSTVQLSGFETPL